MIPKVLGKDYLIAFCKGCERGFRVREEPLFEGKAVEIRQPETHRCPGCGHTAEYQPRDMQVARYKPVKKGPRKRPVA